MTNPPMLSVLIVDDEAPARARLRDLLADVADEVPNKVEGEAANGVLALEILAERQVDVLLLDIRMPKMDGIELARRATELDPDNKVMFITGFAAVALNPDSQTPKDAKVLSKPFHLRELVNEVEKLLAA